jgi:hypothetical protein|uniref:Uncharacterized protein n=1 Tax=Siphoviridae sp. ctf8W5 TaxID=2825595 RepID=A0A8S5Q899_9CAUD|nr:MAG TPA: hypothetical protein [Siphoviridae sp. ctf8W5]
MIISETVTLNDKNFTKTYSDAGFYIERNGVHYAEAIDPLGSGREYTETDTLIETESATTEEQLRQVTEKTAKNSADIEYLAMMTNTDLEV